MEERQTCDLAGIWRFEIDKEDRGFAEAGLWRCDQ